MAAEVLASGWQVATVCATADWMEANGGRLGATEAYTVNGNELQRLSGMQQPNEVWMLVRRQTVEMNDDGIVLVLDHLQDPGNMGTIIRTADWMGIRRMVCSCDTVSCFNPKVVQASMGGFFRTRIDYCDLTEWMDNFDHPIYGTVLDGADVYAAEIATPCAVVVGNESKGISDEVRKRITQGVTIPNYGGTCESLNASVATAIVCGEIMRRRRKG